MRLRGVTLDRSVMTCYSNDRQRKLVLTNNCFLEGQFEAFTCRSAVVRGRSHRPASAIRVRRPSEPRMHQDREMMQSANDEVRMPEALGVIKEGNDRGRYAEQTYLVRARHLHGQRLCLRVFQR